MRTPSISRRAVIGLTGALLAPAWRTRAKAQSVRRAAVANGRRFLQYDVFTDRPLTGNQVAVFMEAKGLATETMAAMTRETNFSEATFVTAAEQPQLSPIGVPREAAPGLYELIGRWIARPHNERP